MKLLYAGLAVLGMTATMVNFSPQFDWVRLNATYK
jgi:hypothetical protein